MNLSASVTSSAMKAIIFIILSAFVSLFESCKDDPVIPEIKSPNAYIESVKPNGPYKIGELIKIIIKIDNSHAYLTSNQVFFNDRSQFDYYINQDTIITYVPYIPTTLNRWVLHVKTYLNPGKNSLIYDLVDTIDVIPADYLEGIKVKWNDLGAISEKDSFTDGIFIGNNYKWTGKISGDTVTVSQKIPGSQGSDLVTLTFLDRGKDVLPQIIKITRTVEDSSTKESLNLQNGLVKIQSWNRNGIVSGIVLPELYYGFYMGFPLQIKKTFWFDFGN